MNNSKSKKLKKRFVTLIEMMIVMFLIALITGVVAYNYRGTLDEGKAFKTKTGMERVHSVLTLALAENSDADMSPEGWKKLIRESPLVKNPEDLMKDGWGDYYNVTFDEPTHSITISSENYDRYKPKK